MRLPVRDYMALGLMAPAFLVRRVARWAGRTQHREERHYHMLSYLMLTGYDYDGFSISAYDDGRTRHAFWCGNWPYAYGDYSMLWDAPEKGVAMRRFGIASVSLRNAILCRQMERAACATRNNRHNTDRSHSDTVKGMRKGGIRG